MEEFIDYSVNVIGDLPIFVKSLALIFSVALEYIFPIYPGDTIVLLAGFLNAYDALLLADISFAILVGTLVGSSAAYWIGVLIYKYKDRSRFFSGLIESKNFEKFSRWYKKWGAWFLLFNRFFPGIRAFFFVAAGALRLPFLKVLAIGGLSAILYNSCLILLGYILGFNANAILTFFYKFNVVAMILLGIFILTIFFLVIRARRKR